MSDWLAAHNLLPPEESRDAEVLWAVNAVLEEARHDEKSPGLRQEIARELGQVGLNGR